MVSSTQFNPVRLQENHQLKLLVSESALLCR
jgi:hypothetical protein